MGKDERPPPFVIPTIVMPPPHRVEALSDDACLTSVCLSDVSLSRTSGLSQEQSQWAGGLLSLA